MTPTQPPLSATARSCSSSMLRQCWWTPSTPVCDTIGGWRGGPRAAAEAPRAEGGLAGDLERVEVAAPVDVREVDDHAAALALADRIAAEPGQPGRRVGAAAAHRPTDRVGREVEQSEVAHAPPGERLDRVELALERLAA